MSATSKIATLRCLQISYQTTRFAHTASHVQKPTLPTFSLAGRTAVITGGARGLGLAMSRSLVLSGANLAIVDLEKDEAAHQATRIAKEFKSMHPDYAIPKITTHHADVSDQPRADATIQDILQHHDRITNLVTCAGYCENVKAIDMPPARIKRMLSVNLEGTYYYATALARHLISQQQPGNMVFIGSISGSIVNTPQPQALYNASKAAVRHLAASLAVEWASRGIRVNCLSPGYMLTDTAMNAPILEENPGLRERWESRIPQGRMGPPEELMGAVVFLSGDASAYVTGQEVKVDGGYTVC